MFRLRSESCLRRDAGMRHLRISQADGESSGWQAGVFCAKNQSHSANLPVSFSACSSAAVILQSAAGSRRSAPWRSGAGKVLLSGRIRQRVLPIYRRDTVRVSEQFKYRRKFCVSRRAKKGKDEEHCGNIRKGKERRQEADHADGL